MATNHVTKVYRQRSSLVTSLPIAVRVKLGLNRGDHIVWQVVDNCQFVQVSKVVAGGNSNDDGKGNSDQKDKGRRT